MRRRVIRLVRNGGGGVVLEREIEFLYFFKFFWLVVKLFYYVERFWSVFFIILGGVELRGVRVYSGGSVGGLRVTAELIIGLDWVFFIY